jgi:beta-lactamase superfamily II metal-dependent hydrolase
MLAIDMLPGGHGDALIVEYGDEPDIQRVLVDGGTVHSWEHAIRPALLKRLPQQRLEAFVVTHVDEDHIGGSLKILKDQDLSLNPWISDSVLWRG